jgi:hypothetical protein
MTTNRAVETGKRSVMTAERYSRRSLSGTHAPNSASSAGEHLATSEGTTKNRRACSLQRVTGCTPSRPASCRHG